MRLEEKINTYYNQLSKTDFNVLNYLITHKHKIIEESVDEISKQAFVSPASIIRCAKKLGFSGFSELKYFIKEELHTDTTSIDTSTNLLKKDISDTVNLITQTDLTPICKKIEQSQRIFIYGTDWGEKLSCSYLARNFMACGIFMHEIPSITEMNWNTHKMSSDDLVIIFSYSGEALNTKQLVSELKIRNIPIISITPLSGNYLSSEANYRLYYKATQIENENDSIKEFNFFTSLNVLTDFLFRYYYDNHYTH